eukprot:TRINITY_DN5830_c0_g4_i1.p1 TRINITY_DN5830_c0_g4~~TRINITY_DN5830_c0_g4_i1.p1  ORF type:complete len:240 (-),score=21.01 TRINITY_DN5830_c0_g4_i1:389-1108(-)
MSEEEGAAGTVLEGIRTRVNGAVTEEGEFHNNALHGMGVRKNNSYVYRGQFVTGLRHGQGVCTVHANGFQYAGDWVNDRIVRGTLVFREAGEKAWCTFEGAFENSSPMHGKLTYPNGNVYEGGFKARSPDGKGTMKYSNGGVYEGHFWLGMRDGKGTMLYPNGEVQHRRFHKDKPCLVFSSNSQPHPTLWLALLYVFGFLFFTCLGFIRVSLGIFVLNMLPVCHMLIVWLLQGYFLEKK